jgi:hypothetical protein
MMLPMASLPALPNCNSENAPEVVEHALTRRVQAKVAPYTLEQPLTERAFELVKHLRRGWLREPELLGGPAQRRAFLDGEQQCDLPHAQTIEQLGG